MKHGRLMVVTGIAVALVFVGAFVYRTFQTTATDEQLCSALRTIILEIRASNPEDAATYNRWISFLPDCEPIARPT